MRPSSNRLVLSGFGFLALTCMTVAYADEPVRTGAGLVFPENAAIPRNMTKTEAEFVADAPLAGLRGATPPPSGPLHCVAEYEPMESILMSWDGSASWNSILAQMAAQITTVGDADVWMCVDTTSERSSASSSIQSAGANMSRVHFLVTATDTIWIRDYGPRYIYEGNVRAIVDHAYNRPRPNDDVLPFAFANLKQHEIYEIPLVHGGGNYHLNALGESYATRLINNENPGLTEAQIHDYWQDFQNVDTQFRQPFPTSVDSTQHIDMWMQIAADNKVVISDWPTASGSTQDNICDNTTTYMAGRGFTVYRTPARQSGGVHYTYTNVVMCNNLVMIPSYTNPAISPYNSQALSTWQTALPGKTIIQIPSEPIVSAAGVLHCIVMHIPEPVGGEDPTVFLKNLRGGESLDPSDVVAVNWISDDDVDATTVDIRLSTDGGATFPITVVSGTPDDGAYNWTVPDLYAPNARLRLIIHDGAGNTGSDESDADFAINGAPPDPCPADLDGSGSIDLPDVSLLLAAFGACSGDGNYNPAADLTGDDCVALDDLSTQLAQFGALCP